MSWAAGSADVGADGDADVDADVDADAISFPEIGAEGGLE